MNKREVRGYSYIDPEGRPSSIVYPSVSAAQDAAAFASNRPCHSSIEIPKDWKRAYKQGFRIAKSVLKAGHSVGSWAVYKYQDGE